ncbi:MAG: mRNA surveillance protein pelota, partial [Euryarchaeota archaeon]|nr:mRNA surveillance protein pelota [Euryarchaeota archaeon]
MKLIHRNLKEGKIKLKPETLDDLWYLKNIIIPGDLISGRSYRRIRDEEKLRADKGVRVPISVDIRAENVEFHPYIMRLRITGKIERGPEDIISLGSYQTIEVQPNDVIAVTKAEWKGWEIERLKEAEQAAKTPLVLIVSVEEGEAEFALVRRYGLDFPVRVTTQVPGKRVEKDYENSLKEFYSEVAGKISETLKKEEIKAVIINGPGFTKENLLAFLKEKHPKIAEICHLESTGAGGRPGVQEVLKRGAVDRIVENSRVSLETNLVEKLFEEIGKNTMLATYGLEEVKKALEYGAVEKLLISDAFLRRSEASNELIEKTKKTKGEAIIISTEHEAGERLQGIGGIAALL